MGGEHLSDYWKQSEAVYQANQKLDAISCLQVHWYEQFILVQHLGKCIGIQLDIEKTSK